MRLKCLAASSGFISLALLVIASLPLRVFASPPTEVLEPPSCRFSGEFEQNRAFPDGVNFINAGGQFYFDCNQGLVWSIKRPITSSQVFNLDGEMYLVDPYDLVTQLKNPVQRQVGSLLTSLLSGDTDELRRKFKFELDDGNFVLEPRSVMLSRAIRQISMRPGATSFDRDLVIEQIDDQRISIRIKKVSVFDSNDDGNADCSLSLGEQSDAACGVLFK